MSGIDISSALAGEGQPVATGRRCRFGKLLDAVPSEQAAELMARLDLHDRGWTDHKLAKLISGTAFGHINASSLSQHRNAVCICDAPTEKSA